MEIKFCHQLETRKLFLLTSSLDVFTFTFTLMTTEVFSQNVGEEFFNFKFGDREHF